jgi:ATP-binding cassette subfamily F protein uup
MERFLFPGSLQWTPIARLSGGEKRRLYLLRILMESPNVLLLDEPTNDLDLETMAVLESFIDDFNGAIILVSHDRFFVDRLADKCFVYEPGGELRMYPGGYSYYKEKEAEEQAEAAAAEAQKPAARKPAAESSAEDAPASKGAAGQSARPKKLTFKEQKEYAEIEDIIASKEGELKATELLMQQNASDYGKLADLTKDQQRLQAELDHLMERWAYLEEIAEGS